MYRKAAGQHNITQYGVPFGSKLLVRKHWIPLQPYFCFCFNTRSFDPERYATTELTVEWVHPHIDKRTRYAVVFPLIRFRNDWRQKRYFKTPSHAKARNCTEDHDHAATLTLSNLLLNGGKQRLKELNEKWNAHNFCFCYCFLLFFFPKGYTLYQTVNALYICIKKEKDKVGVLYNYWLTGDHYTKMNLLHPSTWLITHLPSSSALPAHNGVTCTLGNNVREMFGHFSLPVFLLLLLLLVVVIMVVMVLLLALFAFFRSTCRKP